MSTTRVPEALRQLVRGRARGCCEYCLVPESDSFRVHEVDHIIAEKHGGETSAENLALCCSFCNRRKGSDLSSIDPQTKRVTTLYHPRRDRWRAHFRLADEKIIPLTHTGRATVHFLQLNNQRRLTERRLFLASGTLGKFITK